MHQFSIVLFVDGNPVGYTVYQEQDRVVLNPSENPNRNIYPPTLSARRVADQWLVDGTTDRDLIDQVIEDMTLNEGKIPQNSLSAAP
jgi:hypothetical protein